VRSSRLWERSSASVAQGRYLAALGPSPYARAKLVWAAVWLAARRRSRRPVSLTLAKDGRRVRLSVRDPVDLVVLGEVLVDEDYNVPGLDDVREIVDLGSHIGASIAFFRMRYPQARIHGFEPDPSTFARLQANVGAFEGVTLDPRAVSDSNGESLFYSSDHSPASSLVAATGGGRHVPVRSVTLDSIIEELGSRGVDLLKLDVEGAEYDILAQARRLRAVRAIAGELHPGLIAVSPEEFFRVLAEFEVRVTRISASSWHFTARRA
jgi:FkbM family methyltransferase